MPSSSDFILALDQGTTSSRALLIDRQGLIVHQAQKEFKQHFPQPGWVEHDPEEIWESQAEVVRQVVKSMGQDQRIVGVGITNQRETTIIWDRQTGRPLHNAIVWQDRRTAELCETWKKKGLSPLVQERTGLVIDAYFSASKISWLLDHIPDARRRAEKGELAFGTVDSWLIWKLTQGRLHASDITNASRTMLLNIKTGRWDPDLLKSLDIPASLLPEVRSCSEIYASIDPKLFGFAAPLAGVAGDQQAAMFGQLCLEPGSLKNTYGTGCFLMLNTGNKPIASQHKLLATVAWQMAGETTYALEGSVFIGGAVVQWLRDGLGMIAQSQDIESLAGEAPDNGGVYFVPAFTGLGAPYWDPYARGTIIGITRGTRREHIARAALEAIAFQTRDVVDAMRQDASIPLRELRVDGGASVNHRLMQFQADMLGASVLRPKHLESTAMGAAYFAGLATGFFPDLAALKSLWQLEKVYEPQMEKQEVARLYRHWQAAVQHAAGWARDNS